MLIDSSLFEKLTDFLSGKRQPVLVGNDNILAIWEGCGFGCSNSCHGGCGGTCEGTCMDTCIANCESGKGNSSKSW